MVVNWLSKAPYCVIFDARTILWLCIKLETFTLIEVNLFHLFVQTVLKCSGMEDPVEGFGSIVM
jgi:hypothetical protein